MRGTWKTWSTLILLMLTGAVSLPAFGEEGSHFQLPFDPTDYERSCDYFGTDFRIRGIAAEADDEVAFFAPNGAICGAFEVGTPGQYGIVHVYGIEGLASGAVLSVKVWDRSAGLEYSSGNLILTPGTAAGFSVSSEVPPVWEDRVTYALNIDTTAHVGDINDDGNVDLVDVLQGLQIVSGVTSGYHMPQGADVDGDQRVSLGEVIYALQVVAGLQ